MNKKIQLTLLMFAITLAGFAQVGIGTTTPDASAALDITATDKGFLIPRMTTAQKTAIASPAMGLQVFDTDTKSVWVYDGTTWKESVGGTGGKFVDGATPDVAYYNGKVAIGDLNGFGNAHKLYVSANKADNSINTPGKFVGNYTGTGTSDATYGLAAEANNTSTGTINYGIAMRPIVSNDAIGTVNIAVGTWPEVNNKGVISYAAGAIGVITNNGTITTADGIAGDINNMAGKQLDVATSGAFNITNNGTMNKANGIFINYAGTATVTDSYALYIENNFNKGTNDNFAIYSATNADSYFNGNVGVGVTAPKQKIHIGGAMRLEPQAAAPAGALGDLYVGTDGKLYFHNGTAWKAVQLAP